MKSEYKNDLIILYSGGADSRLMLEIALATNRTPYCLLINYGQKHIKELEVAKNHLDEKSVPYQIININNLNVDSGLTGDGNKNNTGVVHEMHVPGRNSIFLSLAFSVAESKDIDTIWIGCDYSDAINLFPDCLQSYILKISELFKIAGPKEIKVEAPLLGFTKELALDMLEQLGVSQKEIFSGYGDK